jgi:DNA/RNA-binding domain of Phe-tRNA-synthetase-like protein
MGPPQFTRDAALAPLRIPVAFLVLRAFERRRDPVGVTAACAAFVADLLAQTSLDAVAAEPALAGYRALHAQVGRTGRQYLPAPESLFRQIFKRGAWRAIDPLVDAYGLVSLRTRVSIGAHDLARLRLPVRLAVTGGGESLLAIGERTPVILGAGEYAYVDADGQLLGRMECRQAQATCVTPESRDLLFILQGHAALGAARLRAAAAELLDTLSGLVGDGSAEPLSVLE